MPRHLTGKNPGVTAHATRRRRINCEVHKTEFVPFSFWLPNAGHGFGGGAAQADQSPTPPPVQAAQQTPEQLQKLVAPIALYPDALVAQILAAAPKK